MLTESSACLVLYTVDEEALTETKKEGSLSGNERPLTVGERKEGDLRGNKRWGWRGIAKGRGRRTEDDSAILGKRQSFQLGN